MKMNEPTTRDSGFARDGRHLNADSARRLNFRRSMLIFSLLIIHY